MLNVPNIRKGPFITSRVPLDIDAQCSFQEAWNMAELIKFFDDEKEKPVEYFLERTEGNRAHGMYVLSCPARKDKNGEKQEKTEWHRATVAFNDELADLADGLQKGQRVRCVGKMTYRKWTDQSGVERTMAEVQIGRFGELEVLADDRGERRSAAPQRQAEPPRQAPARQAGGGDLDDDIPFGPCWQ